MKKVSLCAVLLEQMQMQPSMNFTKNVQDTLQVPFKPDF